MRVRVPSAGLAFMAEVSIPIPLASRLRSKSVARWAALLLLLAIAFTAYEVHLARSVQPELVIEMFSSADSQAQLFWDTHGTFDERESSTQFIRTNWSGFSDELRYILPGTQINKLRFDPITSQGRVTIRSVEVRGLHRVLLRIPPARILSLNQIASRTQRGPEVSFVTTPDANDPQLSIQLTEPLQPRQLVRRAMWIAILAGNSVILALALLTPLWLKLFVAVSSAAQRIDARLAAIAERISVAAFVRFDSTALWFYAACLALFIFASAADLNGSSTGVYRDRMHRGGKEDRLVGTPRPARSDEWSYETPAILNQALRADRFATFDTQLGGHNVSLLSDIPVRHVSTLFRPQYWSFFVLPVDYAFSVFWQFKALVLLTGVFSVLFIATGSSGWAIFGSLWYFFSPMMQWDYSWASALPEMVGLICWTTALACFIAVGRNLLALSLAAAGMAICAIDFALCAYVPHMVPLVWIMLLFFAGWCAARREFIWCVPESERRILAAAVSILVIGVVGAFVYLDVRDAIAGIANTFYPGRRVYQGANGSLFLLGSHLFGWTEAETHFPPALANISEASGILWLAPVTLFCFTRRSFSRTQRFAFIALWAGFLLLFCWLTLPIPASIAKWLALDKTAGTRLFPALGLANVAIVSLAMAAKPRLEVVKRKGPDWLPHAFRLIGIFPIWISLALLTNQNLSNYFSWPEVFLASCAATFLTMLVLEGRGKLFALALVGAEVLLFGAVNPVTRGLPVLLHSDLFRFVHANPELLKRKWIVFSENYADSGYINASGADVYTGLHYLPDVDHFQLFVSRGWDLRMLNNDFFLMANPIDRNQKGSMQNVGSLGLRWNVYPGDPILKLLGIKYAAFASKPDSRLQSDDVLRPLADKAVDTFWLYELR